MEIYIRDIEWDISDEEFGNIDVDLPSNVNTTTEMIDTDWGGDPSDDIADWLSDRYGFCVKGFRWGTEDTNGICAYGFQHKGGNDNHVGLTEDDVLDTLQDACQSQFGSVERAPNGIFIDTGDGNTWCVSIMKCED